MERLTQFLAQSLGLRQVTLRQRRPRELTLRVDEIPTGTSTTEVENELQSIIAASPDFRGQLDNLVVRSLTPRDGRGACATVTVRTLLPEKQLLDSLKRASTGRPYRYDCTFYGITPLYEDAGGAHCDLIAVPGLASHAISSWKAPGGNDLWLRDWLPDDIANIRVLLYGYDTTLLKSNSTSSIEDLGRRFLESLTAFRTSDKALVHASRSPASSPTHRLLSRTCCGLLFFGVPQLGLRNEKLASVVEGQPNQALIRALVVDDESEPSDFLARMADDFARCFQDRLRVVAFYERRQSATIARQPDGTLRKSGPPVLMVTKKSATSTGLTAVPEEDIVPLDADHSGLVQFASRRDDSYVVVKERIKSLASGAASWILDPQLSQNRYDRTTGTYHQEQHTVKIQENVNRYIADLRVTDPRHDKTRIQDTKGGLLADSYIWVLTNPDFRQWRDNNDQRLLWVKGDPGKGKTMLLCGIIDELAKSPAVERVLAYFFCQATDGRLNTATAVVRGLIFMLLDQDASLVSYIKEKYHTAGKALFEDANAWQALSKIFKNMLRDPKLQGVCLVVDALDECVGGLPQLLELIVETARSTRVKWLVSSRNWQEIEEQLCQVAQRLSLEVNEKSVAAAVDIYITHKVSQLMKQKGYQDKTADEIRQYLSSNANGTFLWVALVCQELEKKSRRWNALQKAQSFPSGLDTLYERMMQQIRESEDAELCTQVLALITTEYRPLSLAEIVTFMDNSTIEDTGLLKEIIGLCGSFLEVREDTVYIVHQSAKDFLMNKQSDILFPQGQKKVRSHISPMPAKAKIFLTKPSQPDGPTFDFSDTESLVSIASLESDMTSLSSHSIEIVPVAASQLVDLLISDEEVKSSLEAGYSTLGSEQCLTICRRLFKMFGQSLREEASTNLQIQTAIFVRKVASDVTAQMGRMLSNQQHLGLNPGGEDQSLKDEGRLESWLQSQPAFVTTVVGSQSYDDPMQASTQCTVIQDDDMASEPGSETQETAGPPPSTALQQVKDFILLSQAFPKLRSDMRQRLVPTRELEQGQPPGGQNLTDTDCKNGNSVISAGNWLELELAKPEPEIALPSAGAIRSPGQLSTDSRDPERSAQESVAFHYPAHDFSPVCEEESIPRVEAEDDIALDVATNTAAAGHSNHYNLSTSAPNLRSVELPNIDDSNRSDSPIPPVKVDTEPSSGKIEKSNRDDSPIPTMKAVIVPTPYGMTSVSGQTPEDKSSECYYTPTLGSLARRFVDAFYLQVEPEIRDGTVRVRWQCVCGDWLWDDITESRPDAAQDFITELQQHGMARCSEQRDTEQQVPQGFSNIPSQVLRTIRDAVGAGLKRFGRRSTQGNSGNNELPLHATSIVPPIPVPPNHDCLYVLFCIDRGSTSTYLYQEGIGSVTDDKELFNFLRIQYHKHRKPPSWFSSKNLKSLSLAKFQVDANRFAITQSHREDCLSAKTCTCIPPKEKVIETEEYRCEPAPREAPKNTPVLKPRHLKHYFDKPHRFEKRQTAIWRQLPKHTRGDLEGPPGDFEDGWGLHFEEGSDLGAIKLVFWIICLVSICMGSVWGAISGDVQTAFAVPSTLVAVAAGAVTLAAYEDQME